MVKNEAIAVIQVFMRGGCFCYYCYTLLWILWPKSGKYWTEYLFLHYLQKMGHTHLRDNPPKLTPGWPLLKKWPLHHNNPQMYNEFGNVADSINDLLDLCSPLSTGWSIWIDATFLIYENNKINNKWVANPNWLLCITILKI